MPVGSKPVLELLLKWLRRNGIDEVYITTGYLGHLIQSYCGDGRQWDLKIHYTEETEPLGTIGALSLLREQLDETFLVLNGDVVTDLNLNAFTAYHRRHGAPLTIATFQKTSKLEFGVIEDSGCGLTKFREKPTISQLVSMGVYCMEVEMLSHVPAGVPFGFDDLVFRMLALEIPVRTFLHRGFWLDIGRVEDFQKAQDLGLDGDTPAFEAEETDLEIA